MISNDWHAISEAEDLFRYENNSRFEQNVQHIDEKRHQ